VAGRARYAALVVRLGESRARARLAEFGPRAIAYSGRYRLTDLDMPPYERLAGYRFPQLFSDRLYDPKIGVARRVVEAGLPAGLLPLVLPGAVDDIISGLRMSSPFDWSAIVKASRAFSAADVERFLESALEAGRLTRDDDAEEGAP
jgi:hypothetical protein